MGSRGAGRLPLYPSIRNFAAAALACAALLAPVSAQAAEGAFVVEDAEVDEPGSCKVEGWASFADNRDFNSVVKSGCVVDLGRPVELSGAFSRSRSEGEWGTTFEFEGKINLVPVATGRFGLALVAGAEANLTRRNFESVFVTVPLTYKATEELSFNFNAGWEWDPSTGLHAATWGVSAEWEFVKKFKVIGEVFGVAGPEQNRDPRAQIGLRFTPQEHYDIDVIYGRNIMGENANWITVGLNLRFDANGGK